MRHFISAAWGQQRPEEARTADLRDIDVCQYKHLGIRIIMAVVAAAILASMAAAYRTATQYLDSSRWVDHSHEVVHQLHEVRLAVAEAETGQRGYIITGDPEYLEPYDAGRSRSEKTLTALRALITDNPAQQARLATLEPLVQAKLGELEQTVAQRRTQGVEAVRDLVVGRDGRRQMDAVRNLLAEMEAGEARILEDRQRRTANDLGQAQDFQYLVALLGGGLVLLAIVLIERDLGRTHRLLDAESAARRRGDAALIDHAEQSRSIADSIGDAIITIDTAGAIQAANAATERIFGYIRDELLGRNVKLLIPEARHEEHDQYLAAYNATGIRKGVGLGREATARRKDGTVFPIDLTVTEAVVGGRRIFASIVRDLEEHKQAEAEVRKLQHLVEERSRLAEVGAVAAKIVHDISNPFAAVSMQVQMLRRLVARDSALPLSTIAETSDRLQRSVGHIDVVLGGLRDFSRQQRLEVSTVDPVRLATAACELWQPIAAARGVTIGVEVHGAPPAIPADEGKLQRVIDNLLKNAIEAVEPGPGEVMLIVSHREDPLWPLRISVADTGPGIPKALDVFRLFETTKPTGSGLGLPIVQQIVTAHGGNLSFTDRQPHGTVFHVDLRERPNQAAQAG